MNFKHKAAKVAISAATATALLGAAGTAQAAFQGRDATGAASPTPALLAAPGTALDHPITGQFQRRALNALLVPLLDDAEPVRWTDTALRHFCGPGTRVEIDGQPLVPGAAVPATAFTVRWHIDQCWPLDCAAFELSGVVDLVVYREDTGLSAIVSAQRLRIATNKGSASLAAPFSAAMELGGSGSASPQ